MGYDELHVLRNTEARGDRRFVWLNLEVLSSIMRNFHRNPSVTIPKVVQSQRAPFA